MRRAFENIKKDVITDLRINATHFYVKFKPTDDHELDILENDTSLVLYDYPLDHETIEGQYYFHDKRVSEGKPTYQYASVPVRFEFPKVEYEIIEELFIPEELDYLNGLDDVVDILVYEALRITNNLDDDEIGIVKSSKWTPSGKIRHQDDHLGLTGIEGVVVRATRWFTTHKGTTDSLGNFTCDGT